MEPSSGVFGCLTAYKVEDRLERLLARSRAQPVIADRQFIGFGAQFNAVGKLGNSRTLEKLGNINTKKDRYLMQLAGGDAVGPLFVFLNLLKCKSEPVPKFFLAYPEELQSSILKLCDD